MQGGSCVNDAETKKILAVISDVYPTFLRERDPGRTVELWRRIFEDDAYETVSNALMAFVATDTKGFPPMPGAIKEKIRQAATPPESKMTEVEAWSLVLKAIRSANWYAEENFEKLPSDIKRLVGAPQTLREWAMMPEDDVYSVVASNFQRSYRAIVAAQEEFAAIPPAFRISSNGPSDIPLRIGETEP